MSLNLNLIKKKVEEKIRSNQQKEALRAVLLNKLKDDFSSKDLKEARKKMEEQVKKRNDLEEKYQERLDKLEEVINEYHILRD